VKHAVPGIGRGAVGGGWECGFTLDGERFPAPLAVQGRKA